MLIDTHAHLNFKNFDKDREEVILRAFQSGVKKIINIGTDLKESRASVKLAEKYENIYASVGIHPSYFSGAKEFSTRLPDGQVFNFQFPINFQFFNFKIRKDIKKIKKLAEKEKVVAIGEIGLDYFSHGGKEIADKQKKIQKEGFNEQLKLAQELNLPVIIHCRASEKNPADAYEDCYQILTQHPSSILPSKRGGGNKIVFHCYGGNMEFTKKLLKYKNIHFSFTGNITYKTKKEIQGTEKDITEVVKIIPLERIMLETDCPFLAPQKFRGKRNEPAFVKYTAEKLAEIKGVSFEKMEKITTQNAKKFFGI